MNHYRIIHKSLINEILDRPQAGAHFTGDIGHLLTFDSFAMAVLEHPFFKLVLGMPSTFHIVVYSLPDYSIKRISNRQRDIYQENALGTRKFGRWINSFLQNNNDLIAQFPSLDWPSQSNFIINIYHPLFKKIVIKEIYPVNGYPNLHVLDSI